jgi:AraC-like DNA-binding protein
VVVCFLRRQGGSAFAVRQVALRGRTACTESRATFGGDVEHGASWCGFELDRSALDLRLASADAGLMRLLEDHADRIGTTSDDDDDLVVRVRDLLLARGARVGARPADVAAALGMAERTLRRRLALAGRSFRDMLDDVLGEAAQRMLAERTVDQVAAELGYAEPAAFRRAHRRWSGAAPRVVSPRVR